MTTIVCLHFYYITFIIQKKERSHLLGTIALFLLVISGSQKVLNFFLERSNLILVSDVLPQNRNNFGFPF
jgi:hypothetical protein